MSFCPATPKLNLALVLGGARSGKSGLALALAERFPAPRLFVATAQAHDEEMAARVARHQAERGKSWDTLEAPLELETALEAAAGRYGVVLVDCLTLWLTNLLLAPGATEAEVRRRGADLAALLGHLPTPAILVSNEVGWGIVPEHPLGRQFRDQAGWLHQTLAQAADLVVLAVAGLPLALKGDAAALQGLAGARGRETS
jgi:adenosylcobinamide kinase/adenosylcobinamide-phosphate guanylyltransferase